jgi:hypothetical protein
MLHDPAQHEPLTERAWDEPAVRDAIAGLVADAETAYDPDAFWPAHAWDGFQAALPLKNLYLGAAGVLWALSELAASRLDLPAAALRAWERFVAEPDFMSEESAWPQRFSALLTGETGILLVVHALTREGGDRLLELVRGNLGNDANDLMWGVPGTLLAARTMAARTGDPAWVDAARESADALRAAREPDGLWTQRLWGRTFRSLGIVHGLTGNVVALGEVGNAAGAIAAQARREADRANWGEKLQLCDGAPGIVVGAAGYLDEELLLAGARLIWAAGPPRAEEKGCGICHGTAGNGYALLKTFERTGEELWLERARAFAVHALEQARRLPPRYSLFTGGLGAALFARDCLDARARVPVLDRL